MPQTKTPSAAPDPALRAKVERMLDAVPETEESPLPGRDVVDLPLPHERDQSLGAEGATGQMGTGAAGAHQRGVMKQAQRDLAQGQVDTDLRATPGLDASRREAVVDDPKARDERRRDQADKATPPRH